MKFSNKMEEMKKSITTVDLRNVRNKMQEFKKAMDQEPKCSCQDAIDCIEYLVNGLDSLLRISSGYDFQQETIDFWKKEKISIFKIIRETADFWNGYVDLRYTEDMNKNIINLARDMIRTINVLFPGTESIIKEGKLDPKQEKDIESKVNLSLDFCGKYWSKEREEMYNNSLCAVCTFLKEIGGLEDYLNIYNSRISELGMQEMQLNYDQGKGKGLLNKILDLQDMDVIKKLDLYTKKILLAFYCNRATKEIEELTSIIFIIKKVGDIDRALQLDDESLRRLVLEEKFLSIRWKREIKKHRENVEKNFLIKEEDFFSKPKKEWYIHEIEEDFWRQGIDIEGFESYFGKQSFEEDKEIITPFSTMLSRIYKMKDASMETLIYMVIKKSKGLNIKNWGYIPEINKNGKNSIESNAENILIGIDFPRYNMPVRLHINREWLQSIVNMTLGNTKIPVYKGNEDFFVTRIGGRKKYMGTQILMPIQKEQRKDLEKAVETQKNNPNYNCIAHLNWLAYPNREPEHLQGQPSKEVDLATGAISIAGVDVGDSDGR